MQDKKQQQYSYVMEEWYQLLQQFTISTFLLALSEEEIKFIINSFNIIYEKYFKELYYYSKNMPKNFIYSSNWLENAEFVTSLNPTERLVKEKLLKRIQQKIVQNKSYFVKLSLRSAKDSLALRKAKERISSKYSEGQLIDSQLERLSLRVNNADQTLQQICSSQRIKDDLTRYLQKRNYKINLIIREWVTIPSSLEFRVFMKNRNITAVCSYYKSEIHDWLIKYKQFLKESILGFFSKNILQQIVYDDGVFDIGFQLPEKQYYSYQEIQKLLDSNSYKIVIIQVNPFSKATGAALFNWETDKNILYSGPFEIRLSAQCNL